MEQEKTCCFTGHRPDRLPWGEQEGDARCVTLKEQLAQAVERAYQAGYRHFITGMARGGDLYFAEAVLDLRQRNQDVTLEAARPYADQAQSWPEEERHRYDSILDQCNIETLLQGHYDRGCMMRRNRYMVDRAKRIIVIYDGVPKGGTAQTLLYALRRGLETDIISIETDETE
jgi:uncharacterized phage-like protein YoqJ